MGSVNIPSAELATTCIETFLYGVFFVLSIISLLLLWQRQQMYGKRNSMSRISHATIMVFVVLVFIANTLHWIVEVVRVFEAFIYFSNGPLEYYGDLSRPTEIVQSAATIVVIVLTDAMFLYRLWIVWAYNIRVVIFPICTWLGLFVAGIGTIYQLTQMSFGESIWAGTLGDWLTTNVATSLCTNVYCTVMIAWRIWSMSSSLRPSIGARTMSVLATIIESAALYSIWSLFFLITFEAKTDLQVLSNETLPFIAGISFTLINVRVGLGWSQSAQSSTSISSVRFGQRMNHNNQQSYVMRPVAININQAVEQEPTGERYVADTFTEMSKSCV
ncbi:uncharacterized protein LAESUDRAFT_816805 [Laetiporus sulphureus 93-53]|uniref:Family A G protein-coupled receptor-like protein n=1 Tax=Laetiporus sulphureus 93-53 TaxID=1314785 RepID=A0A165AYG4_9APHY|nr:uncharacterized protein LAESUDRAFT_816805 [Laetiporus sulphureus 93-53]KZS99896.1 hypothetical protein LAESUDRAFT_816805 [Laetiporus sulphureus 93-53]